MLVLVEVDVVVRVDVDVVVDVLVVVTTPFLRMQASVLIASAVGTAINCAKSVISEIPSWLPDP